MYFLRGRSLRYRIPPHRRARADAPRRRRAYLPVPPRGVPRGAGRALRAWRSTSGYSARALLVEDGGRRGVRLAEVGLDPGRHPKPNHRSGRGDPRPDDHPRRRHARRALDPVRASASAAGANPQVYSLGHQGGRPVPRGEPVRQQPGHAHTGLPEPSERRSAAGSSTALGEKTVAVGLILGLDWKYGDLTPSASSRPTAPTRSSPPPRGRRDRRHRRQDHPGGRRTTPSAPSPRPARWSPATAPAS